MVEKKKQLAHLFDATQCISCGACIVACSQTNFPEMHNRSSDGCLKLIQQGEQPACVQACPAQARFFGDVKDPQSEISKKIASCRTELLMPNKGTKPNFFVVVQK